ncbi:MAG: hypothetical protein NT033_00180 [Candidatus Omnitrophica bacterium]|nr:hypothetical protein [Candidatus Omnitrophota bacterium]
MNRLKIFLTTALFLTTVLSGTTFAYEEVVTVPSENPAGVTLDLEKGEYIVTIEGGAISLFYPINPNYRWLIGVAIGTDAEGGQDEPNIGTVYFDPTSPVLTQAEAERQALAAVKEKLKGTYLRFTLNGNKNVRFWVSDFDYTDNSGMVKLKVRSI